MNSDPHAYINDLIHRTTSVASSLSLSPLALTPVLGSRVMFQEGPKGGGFSHPSLGYKSCLGDEQGGKDHIQPISSGASSG